jgi:hypothetical protein
MILMVITMVVTTVVMMVTMVVMMVSAAAVNLKEWPAAVTVMASPNAAGGVGHKNAESSEK